MKRKKSPDEIPEDGSNEDIRYFVISEDGSRKSGLLKILAGLSRFEDTASGIPEVPPEIKKWLGLLFANSAAGSSKRFRKISRN